MRITYFVILSCVIWTAPARAQGNVNDFGRGGPARDREMYYAQVRHQVNEVLMRWQQAWERDDAAGLANLYADGASYTPPASGPMPTRVSIRDYFADFLLTVGTVHVQMTDFGTSGDLAYMTGRFSYHMLTASGETRQLVSTDMLVLRRRTGDNWQIQAHLSREEPLAENAAY